MYYDTLNSEEQVSYLIKPILEVLQAAGGQLERSEIRDRISELDEHIAEFEQKLYTSNKTGNQYKKFDFKFNFAIKELGYVADVIGRSTLFAPLSKHTCREFASSSTFIIVPLMLISPSTARLLSVGFPSAIEHIAINVGRASFPVMPIPCKS